MNTLGIKSSQTPHTMGIKQHRTPHTMGIKTHMTLKNNNSNQSGYISEYNVVANRNLNQFEPLGIKTNSSSKTKSRIER